MIRSPRRDAPANWRRRPLSPARRRFALVGCGLMLCAFGGVFAAAALVGTGPKASHVLLAVMNVLAGGYSFVLAARAKPARPGGAD